jgi:hypothetical protein
MNDTIKNLCNKIRTASKEERPPLVRNLILEAMTQGEGEEFKTCLAHIESSLGLLPILDDIRDDLRKERDPEKIRGLMTAALKLRNQMKVAAN